MKKKFKRWRIIGKLVRINSYKFWPCVCKCGTKKLVRETALFNGTSTSCGCFHRELTSKILKGHQIGLKHGHCSKTFESPTHISWRSMKDRCNGIKKRDSGSYFEKGVKVCERWQGKNGFINFLADMGERPKAKTLDRIDPSGDYSPENCRWATGSEQAKNKVLFNKRDKITGRYLKRNGK